jgi:hypothetical protein
MRPRDLQLNSGPDPKFTPWSEFTADNLCALAHAGQTKVAFAAPLNQDRRIDACTIINYGKPEFFSLISEVQSYMLCTSVAERIAKSFATDTYDFVNIGWMQAGRDS